MKSKQRLQLLRENTPIHRESIALKPYRVFASPPPSPSSLTTVYCSFKFV